MLAFNIIVAVDARNGIGRAGQLPWHLPSDLKHFKEITTRGAREGKKNVVIMGRKTWESLPLNVRPLPKRVNVVLSRQSSLALPADVLLAEDLDAALKKVSARYQPPERGDVFVIGGADVFVQAVGHPACRRIFLTCLKGDYHCDRFFPALPSDFKEVFRSENFRELDIDFMFCEYQRA